MDDAKHQMPITITVEKTSAGSWQAIAHMADRRVIAEAETELKARLALDEAIKELLAVKVPRG
jgi:hypothetical protein